MADSGFAPAAGTATQEAPQAPAEEVKPMTLDELFAKMDTEAREDLEASPDIANRMVPSSVRKKIINARIDELVKEKYGDDAIKFVKDMNWTYDQLHEKFRSEIDEGMGEVMTQQVDESIEKCLERATKPISEEDPEIPFTTDKKFVTWVDCLIRELLAIVSPTTGSPQSIFFELIDGAKPYTTNGVKLGLMWRTGRATPGITSGSHMAVNSFPWVGSTALTIPEGADDETKQKVLMRRRSYALGVLSKLIECFNS